MKKEEREEKLKERLVELKKFEDQLYKEGKKYIGGIDEVGRGPLAGPVLAAAVILPEDFDVLGIDDSKKLSEKKRELLSKEIKERAVAYGIELCEPGEIDKINILEATKKAMKKAIEELEKNLYEKTGKPIDHLLIDAVELKDIDISQTSIIKGDSNSISIAAASIIAKVARDEIMKEAHKEFSNYAFDKNKGYGTKTHYEGIREHGICPIHRKSFLKKEGY